MTGHRKAAGAMLVTCYRIGAEFALCRAVSRCVAPIKSNKITQFTDSTSVRHFCHCTSKLTNQHADRRLFPRLLLIPYMLPVPSSQLALEQSLISHVQESGTTFWNNEGVREVLQRAGLNRTSGSNSDRHEPMYDHDQLRSVWSESWFLTGN